ncbi:glycosyltransferase [Shimia sp. R9_1]|uniref:glycosyltransferase n=1 Tax=Shimia sp. R9_1 TaxID=2821111 RepID=UPI001ADC3725|nr:glycosyltransferase [Shimia sp. R9_1]MBO9407305.1 glycosyltransferase [Shimia sp. R9_1]
MFSLQNLVFPDPELGFNEQLYFRHVSGDKTDATFNAYAVPKDASIAFDSYFNLFDLARWQHVCDLHNFSARLVGQGQFVVQFKLAASHQSVPLVIADFSGDFSKDREIQIEFNLPSSCVKGGVIYAEFKALSENAEIRQLSYQTSTPPLRWPQMALAITTFLREQAVTSTIERLENFIRNWEFGRHLSLQVVDNGNSLHSVCAENLRIFSNPNYGGAGGFARNLIEARNVDASHCLFMDDDASCHPESIARAYMLLAYAISEHTAVAGAMIDTAHPWKMWENGATFDGTCSPLHNGVDLRKSGELQQMLALSLPRKDQEIYGAWWFFAFPISVVKHYPFPFFVRGDDVNFSLSNPFEVQTLSGVASLQEDFAQKESAFTLYLDMRHPLVTHMSLPRIQKSALSMIWMAVRPILRSMLRLQYAAADMQLLAWRDVMKGPDFFVANLDMSSRRALISSLAASERWQNTPVNSACSAPKPKKRAQFFWRAIGAATLNGHMLPLWNKMAPHLQLSLSERGRLSNLLGAGNITYATHDGAAHMALSHSKKRFWRTSLGLLITSLKFLLRYRSIRKSYANAFAEMTAAEFWEGCLGLPK